MGKVSRSRNLRPYRSRDVLVHVTACCSDQPALILRSGPCWWRFAVARRRLHGYLPFIVPVHIILRSCRWFLEETGDATAGIAEGCTVLSKLLLRNAELRCVRRTGAHAPGDCCHVVVVVKLQRPAFLVCARANTVKAKRQQNPIQP